MSQFNSIFSPLSNKLARLAGITLLAVAALFASTQQMSAQGASCVTSLEVRLSNTSTVCNQTAITPQMLIVGTVPTGAYVKINDLNPANNGTPSSPNAQVDGVSPVGGWAYGVYILSNGVEVLICTGKIYAVDFTPPNTVKPADHFALYCDDIADVLNVPSTWGTTTTGRYYTGRPTFTDNCTPVQLKVTDRIDYTDCASNGVMAIITRRFQAIDQYGNDTTVTQYINFKRPNSVLDSVYGGTFDNVKTTINNVPVAMTKNSAGTVITGTYDAGINTIVFNHCRTSASQTIVPTGTADQKRETIRKYLESLFTYRYGNNVSTGTNYGGTGGAITAIASADSISFFRPKQSATAASGLAAICNFSWDFTYTEFDNCNNGKKFMVNYSIIDWCSANTGSNTTSGTVIFAFEDLTAPAFTAAQTNLTLGNNSGGAWTSNGTVEPAVTDTMLISVGTNDCTASLRLGTAANPRDLRDLFNVAVSDLCGATTLNYSIETKDYYNQVFLVQQGWTPTSYTIVSGGTTGSLNVIGLPVGTHKLKVVAHDACNNRDSILLFFKVVDKVAPVMKCDDQVKVTLTSNGSTNYFFNPANGAVNGGTSDLDLLDHMQARLYAEDLNEGSRDNCTLDSMYVRRKFSYSAASPNTGIFKYLATNMDYDTYSFSGTPDGQVTIADFEPVRDGNGAVVANMYYTPKYMQYVDVFCGEPNDNVHYELWGADAKHYNASGLNWSYCWGEIAIEDKTLPTVNAPILSKTYNATAVNYINCSEKEWIQGGDLAKINVEALRTQGNNLENTTAGRISTVDAANAKFGTPDIYGLECSGDVYYSVKKNLVCDTGVILRIWSVEKTVKGVLQVVADTQRIWVQASHDYKITVPQDRTGDCLDASVLNPQDQPSWDEDGCDLLAMSAANQTVYDATDPADNACKKIYRTWTIINWCQVPNQFTCASADPMNYARIIPRLNRSGAGTAASPFTYLPASATLSVNAAITHKFTKSNVDNTREKLGAPSKYHVWLANASERKGDAAGTYDLWPSTAFSGAGVMGAIGVTATEVLTTSAAANAISDYNRADFPSAGGCALTGEQSFAWQYTQVIKINDTTKPNVKTVAATGLKFTEGDDGNTDEVVWDAAKKVFGVRGNSPTTAGVTGNECKALVEFSFDVEDGCSQSGPFHVDGATVVASVAAGATMNTGGTAVVVEVVDPGKGTTFKIRDNTLNLDRGKYDLIVNLRDDCGNVYVDRIPFEVADIKAPAPVCVQQLTVTLMPTDNGGPNNPGMVVVNATDVFQNVGRDWAEDDCYGLVGAFISREKLTDGTAPTTTSIAVTCADYPNGVTAYVYLKDASGNVGYCQVTIRVEDNNNVCTSAPGSAAVAGAIQTESKATVEGVQVNLSGQTQKSFATGVNGLFVFNNLTAGADYTVTPSLNKGFLNGVSTFDLVLISKHILGVQPLNTPYKLIAADVNNSKSVTTLDLIQLRKLILNIDATFANNSSWRFVDASYTFPNASNPWAASFPEVKNVNDLVGSLSANFVAIKVGDVNGNAIANSTQGSVRNLTSNLGINVADMNLVAGNEYKVDFTAADLNGIEGFQFTLNLDKKGLELVDLVPGIAAEENFGIFAEEGVVTASWNGEAKGGVLFSLVVRAKSNTTLSEVLNLNSRYTAAEAYKGGEVVNVGLNFNASKASANYELYQNTPNPFAGESIIGFNLPVAGAATLTIQDVTGRTLKVINGQYAKGYNQVSLKSTELSATGVLTYTLKAADFTATRKMIIVE